MDRIADIIAACGTPRLAGKLELACRAALAGGAVLGDFSTRKFRIDHKGSIDLVTEADIATEKIVIETIGQHEPTARFMAEESAPAPQNSDQGIWVIDPLDGTTNFAHGFPWYAVSIAWLEKDIPQIGVIYHPPLDELYCAVINQGCWLNGKPVRTSNCDNLAGSLLATGFPYDIKNRCDEVLAALGDILPLSQGVRRAGAAALDLAMLAAGRLEGFWELNLKPWDTAAGMLLVTEAGGTVSNYAGETFDLYDGEILASNGLIHGQMTALLKKHHGKPSPTS